MITSARFLNAEETLTEFVDDGITVHEVGGGNRDPRILAFIQAGGVVESFVPPPAAGKPSPAERLQALGLTVSELKTLLDIK